MRTIRKNSSVLIALLLLSGMIVGMGWQFAGPGRAVVSAQDTSRISDTAIQQIQALMAEKESRTPAQQKLDSQLLYLLKMRRGEAIAAGVPTLDVKVEVDTTEKTVVDITAIIGGNTLIEDLEALGAEVISVFPQYHTLRAAVPLAQLEAIAAFPAVRFIQPKQEGMADRQPQGSLGMMPVTNYALAPDFAARAAKVRATVASALTRRTQGGQGGADRGGKISEGDSTHRAATARATFGVNGAGVRIGVLSDGVNNLAASQATGDLPPDVTVLPGQQGFGDEGTAMMEIIYDLAPGAKLFFATASNSLASFAQNIRNLRAAGCDIIVDDFRYTVETPIQDGQASGIMSTTNGGAIMQAVIDVTADGALYFASQGNAGNKNDNTAGVWEGDFVDGGPLALAPGGTVHNFGGGVLFNTITASSSQGASLYWADPLGGASNDYDLFVLNSTSTAVVASSTNVQTGTQDPFEFIGSASVIANNRLVVLKKTGAANRFFHLSANRGRLAISTDGQTRGHNCAANAFSVAATPANLAAGSPPNLMGPFPSPFNSSNTVELFSSDGPRRIFFQPNGAPITPGNFSSTGGLLRQKPDITAADGTTVTGVGGFPTLFFGTSAAAPHAAAIAALLKSSNPALTPAQIRTGLTSSAIDIEAMGVDRDSGAGIIMADAALQFLGASPSANFEIGAVIATEAGGNGNGLIERNEGGTLTVQLRNTGVVNATGVTANLTTSTPGVTITQGTSTYPDLPAPSGVGTNATPFAFTLSSTAVCPLNINFTLTINYAGGPSPKVADFSVQTGTPPLTINSTLDPTAPLAASGFTAITGLQTGRLNRSGLPTACGFTNTCPGLLPNDTTLRRYDAYTFTNCATSSTCITVSLTNACATSANSMFGSAYLGSFNPNSLCTNYLGDAGVSNIASAPTPFSFDVPAGATFTIVINEINAGGATGCNYLLNLSGLCCQAGGNCPTVSNVAPTIGAATTSVTLTGANFTGVTSVRFANNVPAAFTIVNATTITTTVPSGAVTGPITLSKPGCQDLQTASFTVPGSVFCPSIDQIAPLTGFPGDTVKITGANLTGVSSVKFTNGVAAIFTVVNDTTINATVPGGIVAGPITLSKPGCGDVLTDVFTPIVSVVAVPPAVITAESCGTPNNVIEPGETVTVNFPLRNAGTTSTTNLVATLQATGGVTAPTGPQTYGALPSGGPAVARSFTFTADPTLICGNTLTATLQLQDGARNLGTTTFTFTLGTIKVGFAQNFDGVAAPLLPTGWSSVVLLGFSNPWVTSTTASDTAPNNVFAFDPSAVNDILLNSPPMAITTASAQLTFRNNYNLEDFFDGGVLEISMAGGAFTDIITAGGSFVTGGYNRTISANFSSPIGGRQAWSGSSGGYITTTVNLPATAAGKNITLRWRLGADDSGSGVGWRIDTITITDGFTCQTSCAPVCPTVTNLNPTSGAVGSNVTITGTNFNGVTSVKFSNNVTAVFTVNTSTTMTATVPAGAVTGPITISKTGCGDVQTASFTVTSSCPTITLAPATLPDATGGTAYNQTLTASGGTAPFSFAVTTGALPGGLTLTTGGVLAGTPNVAGTFNFTVTATDANGCTGTRSYTVNITAPPLGAQTRALYVLNDCNRCGNQIYGYAVNETTGALTLLAGFPISTGGSGTEDHLTERLTIDRANQRLYAINDGSNTVSAYAINPTTGALTLLPFSPINLGIGAWNTIAVHPSGSPLIVGDGGNSTHKLLSYQITATTATAAAGSPYSTGSAQPFSAAFSQDSNYVYTGGEGAGTTIAAYSVNAATGVLTALTGSPFDSGNNNPLAYATDAAGRLFAANFDAGQVRVFTTANGIPTAVSGNPFTSGLKFARHGLLHPNGFYLVADEGNLGSPGRVGIYRINGSGSTTTLTAVTGSPFPSGSPEADVLALNQTGTFLFAASSQSNNLTTFSVNPATGALTALGTQPANTLGFGGRLTGMAYLSTPCSTITLSPATLPNGTVNTAYNQTITASPAGGNYTFAVTSGSLPAGLSLNATTGAITGTPTTAGTFNFTVTATGFGSCSGGQAYTINIQAAVTCPTVTNISPNNGAVGSSVTITGTGFTGLSAGAVKFSTNVTATFTVVNDTTITATVPSGAVTGPITISKTGCNDVQTASFTVTIVSNCVPVSISATLTGGTGSSLTVPIIVGDLTGKGVTAYDFTLTFDPAVVKPSSTPFDSAGTLTTGFTITPNTATPGKLTVSAFGTTSLAGAGTLLNLKFDLIGAVAACSNLTWTSFVFNEGTPCATTSNGQICIGGGSIAGTVNYGTSSTPKTVPGATLTAAGTPSATSTTNSAGVYNLMSLGGGPYTVTPAKSGDVNGISSFDASLVAQHAASVITLTANQQIAADASGNGTVSSFDASLIAQTAAGIANTGIAGTWKFVPANRNYPTLSGNQTNQNFDAILVGDVSGNWTPPAPLAASLAAAPSNSESQGGLQDLLPPVAVSLPNATGATGTTVTIPITVGDLTGKGVTAYDVTLTFNPAVLQALDADKAGTLSNGLNIILNTATPGRVTISAFGTAPLTGAGTLLNLRFNVVGAAGTTTTLTWQSFNFNEGDPPATLVNGSFSVPGVGNPVPILTSLNPNTVTAGGAAFTLTVNGTGFINSSVVQFNGANRTTAFVSTMQLTANITAADIATAGTASVRVFTPTPGGGTSNALTLTISCPTITLAPATLPGGTVGTAYNQTVSASPAGSYTFAVTTGTLPAGLTLNPTTGAITGTPTTAGTASFTITATGFGTCTGSQAYTISIQCPTITIAPATLPAGTVGTVYNQTLTASGGTAPYSFTLSAGTLPTGLTLSAAGVLSGTPTQSGTFNITIRATDANGCSGTQSYSIVINCPTITLAPATLPGGTVGTAYNQTVSASPAGSYTFAVTAGSLPAGLSLNSATGAITGTPTTVVTANFTITATSSGPCSGNRAYTIIIQAAACPTITIAPATLPAGTVNAAYTQALTASGGTAPYSFTLSAGTLPTGLTLSTAGVLSGTPTQSGTFNVTIRATDANGCTGTQSYSLVINCPTITLSPATLPGGTVGTAYNQTVSASPAGSYTFAVTTGSLPAGLSLNSTTGAITGTPTTVVTASFTITATSAGPCSGSQTYTISIQCPTISIAPASLPTGTVNAAYNQTLTASGGTAPYSFTLSAGTLPTGVTLSTAGVLSGTPTQSGTFNIAIRATDANGCSGTQSYSLVINCPTITLSPATLPGGTVSTAYNQTITASPAGGNYTFAVTTGTLPAGLSLNSATGAITGTPTTAGTSSFTITATSSGPCSGSQAYTISIQCPTITMAPATLPAGTVNAAYTQTLTASGGTAPYSFTLSAGTLPTGVTLSAAGVLSGTPTQSGTFNVTIRATDANGCSGTQSYSLVINCPTITLAPATLPGGTVGTAYNQTVSASPAGSYTFAVTTGTLPAGLTLNPTTGAITGTPTTAGTASFTITATGFGTCTGSQAYTISIQCPTITIAPATLPAGTVGTVYNQTLTASGGTAPYSFTLSAGTLPTGLTLSAAGVLSGTPTQSGTFNITIRATDANGCSGTQPYSIVINCPTITLAPATLPGGTVGTAYNQTVSASPAGTYTFAVTTGSLPAGLTLNPTTGALTGTPTAAGTSNFTITATSFLICTGNRAYTITIQCPTITMAPATLPAGTVNAAYTQTLTASGGTAPYSFTLSAGTLPTGVTLSAAGVLSGTPTQSGSFNLTIRATDANGCSGTQTYTLLINCPTITLSPTTLPGGTVGTAYNQTVSAIPAGTYTFAVTTGSLPAGLSLNSATGALTGTPTAVGTANFTITATSSGPCSGSQAYTINIQNPVPVLTTLNPSAALFGGAAFTLTVNGTGFVNGSTVQWNGSNRTTTFVSSTQLTAVIPAADIANVGTASVTVVNLAPGGGTSNALTFTILSTLSCETFCLRSAGYYLLHLNRLPNGLVLIGGVNASRPISTSNINLIKIALKPDVAPDDPSADPLETLNREFVAAQLSVLFAGGRSAQIGALKSPLRCYGLNFAPVPLSNGFVFTPVTTLGDLFDQARLALIERRTADMLALAQLLHLLNGDDLSGKCR